MYPRLKFILYLPTYNVQVQGFLPRVSAKASLADIVILTPDTRS